MAELEREQAPELRELLEMVRKDRELARPFHDACCRNFIELYRLYRSYQGLKRAYTSSTGARDIDNVLNDGKRAFGGDLFIPYCFWTVETIVPRLLSNHPRMQVFPREPAADQNVANMKHLIDSQQEAINYGLLLQDPAKNGLIYGLGVTKTGWLRDKRKKKELVKGKISRKWSWHTRDVLTYDDPIVENVDPFDFIFDPDAAEAKDMNFALHRTWKDDRYVKRMVEQRIWDAVEVSDLERLHASGSDERKGSYRNERREAGGLGASDSKDGNLHEVWEYHNGEQVVTVIDQSVVVRQMANPYWHGALPFHVYRPTKVPNELVGIGEIEPIIHLQHEMNTLRQQRRDNATLVLQKAFAYAEGYVDVSKVRFGPAAMIPVNGDPKDLLMPIQIGDIPNSGYQEEANLAADIERVSGISDNVIGRTEGGQTATEAQLVTAAANVRIQNKTWRVEQELAQPDCQQWIELNQQYITERPLFQRAEPEPGDTEADQRWSWVNLSAGELTGLMVAVPVGGASAPDNVPQMRQDATELWTAFSQDPQVDPGKLRLEVLRLMGIKGAEAWILPPPGPPIPPELMDWLVENGVDPAMIEAGLIATQAQATEYAQLPPEEQPQPILGGPFFSQAAIEAEREAQRQADDEAEREADEARKELERTKETLILEKARTTALEAVASAHSEAQRIKDQATEQAAAKKAAAAAKPAASPPK